MIFALISHVHFLQREIGCYHRFWRKSKMVVQVNGLKRSVHLQEKRFLYPCFWIRWWIHMTLVQKELDPAILIFRSYWGSQMHMREVSKLQELTGNMDQHSLWLEAKQMSVCFMAHRHKPHRRQIQRRFLSLNAPANYLPRIFSFIFLLQILKRSCKVNADRCLEFRRR